LSSTDKLANLAASAFLCSSEPLTCDASICAAPAPFAYFGAFNLTFFGGGLGGTNGRGGAFGIFPFACLTGAAFTSFSFLAGFSSFLAAAGAAAFAGAEDDPPLWAQAGTAPFAREGAFRLIAGGAGGNGPAAKAAGSAGGLGAALVEILGAFSYLDYFSSLGGFSSFLSSPPTSSNFFLNHRPTFEKTSFFFFSGSLDPTISD
jgi:hypothetical protein